MLHKNKSSSSYKWWKNNILMQTAIGGVIKKGIEIDREDFK